MFAQNYQRLDSVHQVLLTLPDSSLNKVFEELMTKQLRALPFSERVAHAEYTTYFCKVNDLNKALVYSYHNQASVYHEEGKAAQAYQALQLAVNAAKESSDNVLLMKAHNRMAGFKKGNYLYAEALQSNLEAITLAKELKDSLSYSGYLHLSLIINLDVGNWAAAAKLGRELAAFNKKLQRSHPESAEDSNMHLFNNIALAYSRLDQYDSAILFFERSEAIAVKRKDEFWAALMRGNVGQVLAKQGKNDEALVYILEDVRMSIKHNNISSAINAMLSVSTLYTRKKNYPLAEAYLDSVDYIAKKHNITQLPATYWERLANVEIRKGNYKKAIEFQSQYTKQVVEEAKKKETSKTAQIQSAYDLESKQDEIESLTKNELALDERIRNQRRELIALLVVLVLAAGLVFNLIRSFRKQKKITRELAEAHEQVNTAYHNLKVTQNQLVQTEKMAFLGRLTSGIAHEVNTPLGAIKASSENVLSALRSTRNKLTQIAGLIPESLVPKVLELIALTPPPLMETSFSKKRELKKATIAALKEMNVVHPELMAEYLGSIGIITNFQYWKELLLLPDSLSVFAFVNDIAAIQSQNENIELAVKKASKILFALKSYSHGGTTEITHQIDVTENVEMVLSIYSGNLTQTDVIREFETVPEIQAYPDQLSQVWTNLIHNALQAMKGKGVLTIRIVKESTNEISVSISDTGGGISPENQKRLFQPFFTTKAAGEGTGLGLSIVKTIIDNHKGRIECESEVSKGTTFKVFLPTAI